MTTAALSPLVASFGGVGLYTQGVDFVLQPATLAMIAVSVLFGMLVGAMPGLTANMGVAVLVPLTFTMEPAAAIACLSGIWLGALYGGTVPAVLINIPGTPGDIMTSLDGYPLSRRGKGGLAIGVGVLSSFVGGVISVGVLVTASPVVAGIAGSFGSVEYFAVTMLGLAVIAAVTGSSVSKGVAAAALGLLAGSVGRDLLSGQPRLTFEQPELLNGLELIAVVVGIFGLAEVFEQVYRRGYRGTARPQVVDRVTDAFRSFWGLKGVVARSSVVGVFTGAVPGAGATIASVVAYGTQKRLSREPERMGKGSLEGVAASDSANNACTGGAMVTMLSLGIPGDAVTAILIGALVVQGVQPGPAMFESDSGLVSAIFLSLLVANLFLLVFGLLGARYLAHVLRLPRGVLLPVIVALCVIGTYALNNSVFDVYVMLFFAVVGFGFARLGVPKAPFVLALILGPMLETNLRRSLQLEDGDTIAFLTTLLSQPISLVLTALTVLALGLPLLRSLAAGRRNAGRPGEGTAQSTPGTSSEADTKG
ncbi:tripartite tricarboxylate transporter permease [Allosalinactinospora lopnorensis]|uniref:tripartite tricarboxylate transporter permease n=1 Tax=Allosalinactinospora lopnorensis TaxID=1352348 RepID=UPI0006969AA9|nr:tripartite tricarboxylate transporter permease [Allosalinactinospora lopnorensis]